MLELAALPMEVVVEEEVAAEAHKMVLVNHLLLLRTMMHHLPLLQERTKRLGRSRAEPLKVQVRLRYAQHFPYSSHSPPLRLYVICVLTALLIQETKDSTGPTTSAAVPNALHQLRAVCSTMATMALHQVASSTIAARAWQLWSHQ